MVEGVLHSHHCTCISIAYRILFDYSNIHYTYPPTITTGRMTHRSNRNETKEECSGWSCETQKANAKERKVIMSV